MTAETLALHWHWCIQSVLQDQTVWFTTLPYSTYCKVPLKSDQPPPWMVCCNEQVKGITEHWSCSFSPSRCCHQGISGKTKREGGSSLVLLSSAISLWNIEEAVLVPWLRMHWGQTLIITHGPSVWREGCSAAQMQRCHPVSMDLWMWVIIGFQLCYGTAKQSTLQMKLICAGKNGKPSKERYVFRCFMVFSSSFAPKWKVPWESGLDCQLRKLRKCTHACVYFQNSHPYFRCCFRCETRELFSYLLHTALADWCSVPRKKRNACPKIISHIFEGNKPYYFSLGS